MTWLRLPSTQVFRPVLMSGGAFGLCTLVMFGVMYMAVLDLTRSQLESELRGQALSISDGDTGRIAARVRWRLGPHRRPDSYYLLENAHGEILAGNLPPLPTPFKGLCSLTLPPKGSSSGSERVLTGYGVVTPSGDNLLVARDTQPIDDLADLMERTFAVGVILTLLGAFGVGAFVSRTILRRMDDIVRTSRQIMAGDLSRRIPAGAGKRDFDLLAGSLNEMLTRIQELMAGVQQVADNIAHDMRTPLSRLRQQLDQVRHAGSSIEDFRTAIDMALLETDGLIEMFGALLRIAEIQSKTPVSGLQVVGISELCAMIAETYGPVAETEGHRLTAAIVPALTVLGDRHLLGQLLVNLVENAIQHNPPPVEVRILLQRAANGGGPVLTVADDGVGIPAGERENVLRRFYRLDAARTSEGSGLGLSMVAAIARLHGAALTLEDNEPGLRVAVRFPAA